MSTPKPNLPQVPVSPSQDTQGCRDSKFGCCGGIVTRRSFMERGIQAGTAAAILSGVPRWAVAGPFEPSDTADHFVPADKKLQPEWIARLYERGEPTWYSGSDLDKIAMPVGGICAGQLYLSGDGRLTHWDIFNKTQFSGHGGDNYQKNPAPNYLVLQGFALGVRQGEKTWRRALDRNAFPGVRFLGEYPLAWVEYPDPALPVHVTLQAFSPFIPLNEEDSALPATLLTYTVRNVSETSVELTLGGWLENAVACHSGVWYSGKRIANGSRSGTGGRIRFSAASAPPPAGLRQPRVLADFEGADYGNWTVEGEAFGSAPAKGTLPNQQEVSGFIGKGLVNSYLGGDQPQGRLVSPPFVVDRRFVSFLIGGGNHAGKTCINLIVDGQVVRTAAGQNRETLEWQNWDVREFEGKTAQIEIVDLESGGWGHINIDQIELRDDPRSVSGGPFEEQPDFGTMILAAIDAAVNGRPVDVEVLGATWRDQGDPLAELFRAEAMPEGAGMAAAEVPLNEKQIGGLAYRLQLRPGETARLTFAVAWHFPHRPERGNYYAVRFSGADAVCDYLQANLERLRAETLKWHEIWYETSTLPRWLMDRLLSTASTLATGTCQWWANGRFWAWEGVGCCHGTCAHVWNYEHSMARLFPRLERSVREMQDFNPESGFDEKTGAVRFRGEGWGMWAGDSQGGTVLKAYREHQCSKDSAFLENNWPRIKKCLEFLFEQDGDEDGLIEGEQHNTYDINFFGPNTMIGSLYLAACRAAEEMAKELGDQAFAERCRRVYEAGRAATMRELFNGEYFIQKVDLDKHPKHQYADGCLSDQLFGQGWAHQVGLGHIYPPQAVRSVLKAIWVYNWAPDVGPQNQAHPPQRWFARPGQAGLFTCTWPKSKHLGPDSVLYRDEVWTGIEYQVAGNMVWDGMVTEALAICRGIHERYHPAGHNPWNEIECGDHYARGMASHGVFLALCGFEYHGPKGHMGFAPKVNPERFCAPFTAAEGWGTIQQDRKDGRQENAVNVLWGTLRLKTLALEAPTEAPITAAGVKRSGDAIVELPVTVLARHGNRVVLALAEEARLSAGESLVVTLA